MQNYCGEVKCDGLLKTGLEELKKYEQAVLPHLYAANPHELMRLIEVENILTVAQLIIHSCLNRRRDCKQAHFYRSDGETGPSEPFIVVRKTQDGVKARQVPLDFAGDLRTNYALHSLKGGNDSERV